MPLPRLDLSRPDYLGGVAEAGASFAKTVHDYSPADPRLAKYLKRLYAGEDPRSLAVEAKFEMSRQAQPSQAPTSPAASAPAMRGSMRSSMGAPPGDVGAFTGPREFTEEETVVAQPPPPTRQSMPLASEPMTGGEFYSQAQPPILNKDLPALMQGAGLVRRSDTNDLRSLELGLRERSLLERQRQFDDLAGLRGAREGAMRAQTEALPRRLGQTDTRLGLQKEQNSLGWANLNQRENINYVKMSKDLPQMIASIDQLVAEVDAVPALAPPDSDYTKRRTSEIARGIPFVGGVAGELLEKVADDHLTPQQRDTRRKVALIAQSFIHANFGASVTGHEMQIARELTGQQTSWEDTKAGLRALQQYARNQQQKIDLALPNAARDVGSNISPGPALPPPASGLPAGLEGFSPGAPAQPRYPAGPSLQDELKEGIR